MEVKKIVVGELWTNCYILKNKKQALVIDPGGEPDKILFYLKDVEIKILNTHYHFDHTKANSTLKEKLKCPILIHKEEKEYMDFQADEYLEDGSIVKVGDKELEILHTPGHTQGSICLISKNLVFTGDTLFKDGYGRTDLPGGNPEKMLTSLKKLENTLKSGMEIHPGHGDSFIWEE